MFSFLSDLLRWFGQGLLTRPSSACWFGQGLLTRPSSLTAGLPVPDRWRVTWRPPVGRTTGSGDAHSSLAPRPTPNAVKHFFDLVQIEVTRVRLLGLF